MHKMDEIASLKEAIKLIGKEKLSDESALKAVQNLKNLILNKQDLFLYCSSLNFLNAYVKQGKQKKQNLVKLLESEYPQMRSNKGYGFKKFVNIALTGILDNNFDNVTFSRMPDEDGLVMITIDNLQFSFHRVRIYDNILKDVKEEEKLFSEGQSRKISTKKWEGVRLQPVAQTLFDFASELEGLSGLTVADKQKAEADDKPEAAGGDAENEQDNRGA